MIRCPVCGSSNVQPTFGLATKACLCIACDHAWTDPYCHAALVIIEEKAEAAERLWKLERCIEESLTAATLQQHADHLARGDLFAMDVELIAEAVQIAAARMRVESDRSWAEFCK